MLSMLMEMGQQSQGYAACRPTASSCPLNLRQLQTRSISSPDLNSFTLASNHFLAAFGIFPSSCQLCQTRLSNILIPSSLTTPSILSKGFLTGHFGSFIKNLFGDFGPWIHERFSMEPKTSIWSKYFFGWTSGSVI